MEKMNRMTSEEKGAKRLLREWPLGFVVGCIVFMLHPMLCADFAMIDDHEIVSILGRDNQVRISEIPSLIETHTIERNGRFRPAFYVLRIVEAYFFGGHASLWHTNRLLLAVASALALYCAMRVFLHPFSAGVVTLLLFSGAQNEIWVKLGDAESYGMPLLLAALACIIVQLTRHRWRPTQLFPALALLLLTGLIKESFIPILPGALIFIYGVMPSIIPSAIPRRPPLKALDIFILVFLTAGVGAQIWLTVTMLRTYGHQYATEISITSLLDAIQPTLARYSKDTLWFVPVIVGLVTLTPRSCQEWQEQGRDGNLSRMVVLLTAGLFLILGPQWVVYGGSPWLPGRYLSPGNLFAVFSAAIGLYFMSGKVVEQNHGELRGIVTGMLMTVALFRVLGTYGEANAQALSNQKFQARLAEVVELKAQHPTFPLLFCSAKVLDREPLFSVASFLAVKLPDSGRPFLNTFNWEATAASPLQRKLANSLKRQSLDGDTHFGKIADFHGGDGQCISLMFSGFVKSCRCQYSVHVLDPSEMPRLDEVEMQRARELAHRTGHPPQEWRGSLSSSAEPR
jgi:hypothetical protein